MTSQHVSFRHLHGSIKTRFAYRFLRALKKLNHPATKEITTTSFERCRMVKLASYASMASAVGPRRVWSRAILKKIRNRGPIRPSFLRKSRKQNPSKWVCEIEEAKRLRKLVPGGQEMEFCSLLDETAHYTKCLTSQVQIMRNMVDICSV